MKNGRIRVGWAGNLKRSGSLAGSMPVLNIAMIGSDELAKEIAKSSDQRDVHTYVHKENAEDGSQRILSLIRPARFPERLPPFLEALGVARAGFIEVKAIDAALGEALVAFSSAGMERGLYAINPPDDGWVDEEQVAALIQQAGLSSWHRVDVDGIEIREKLMKMLDEMLPELTAEATMPLIIPIDQHFNVKGIGLVAIGYVQQGSVSVHDELLALPSEGTANARSLQVMDDDVQTAVAGDRVGIAMRNADEAWLSNGAILIHLPAPEKNIEDGVSLPLVSTSATRVKVEKNPFQRRQLVVGDVVHISSDLQFVVGRITEVKDDYLDIEWDSPILIRRDGPGRALLNQLESSPRVIGRITELIQE